MSKLYDTLLAPEWRRAISPANLADTALQVLRTVTARLAALIKIDLSQDTTRPYYRTVSIKDSDIQTITGGYKFPCDMGNIDAFGCLYADKTALRGKDFTYEDGWYTFKSTPSTYGTVAYNEVGEKVVLLIAMGGDLSTNQSPLEMVYRRCTDETTRQAIDEAVYGTSPNGINRHLLEAVGGCRLSDDKVAQIWTEGDYKLGITSGGELVYTPSSFTGITFTSGATINTGNVISSGGSCVYYNWPYINNDMHQQEALANFIVNLGGVEISTTATGTGASRVLLSNTAPSPIVAAGGLVLNGRKGKSFNFQ
jgi:hypothetical protein